MESYKTTCKGIFLICLVAWVTAILPPVIDAGDQNRPPVNIYNSHGLAQNEGPGQDCGYPISVALPTELPYSDSNTTCGYSNDYDSSCLGHFDGGDDIIYEVIVTEAVLIDITVDPKGTSWSGFAVDDSCPPDLDCIATATNSDGQPYTSFGISLEPGIYYIMIDTWPSPDCVPEFELQIETAGENERPVFESDCDMSFDCLKGDTFAYSFIAVDPDSSPGPIFYSLVDGPGTLDSSTGDYMFPTTDDDIGIWQVLVLASDGSDTVDCVIYINVYDVFSRGDADGGGSINVGDAVYIVNYVFKGGPPPVTLDAGDPNCDYTINIADAVYLINHIFKGGPAPRCYIPGACCQPDGGCIEVTEDSCVSIGFTFFGVGVTCSAAKCPQPDCCEITISDCPFYWLPKGRQYGTAVGAPGNSVTFTSTVIRDPPRKIRFYLGDVSSESGVCINYGDETTDDLDLKFIQTASVNPPALFDPPSADGRNIQTKEPVAEATVTVTCYDWGAWGVISACCLDDKGECESWSPLKRIPVDSLPALPNVGNHIADAWEPILANRAAHWDEDLYPENMERKGDGLTFYEEYRGTMNGTSATYTRHVRHSPLFKDLFLYDPDKLHLRSPYNHRYSRVTGILVHYLNGDPAALMNGIGYKAGNHRHVTWKSEFTHTDNQYALHILNVNLSGQGNWGIAAGDPNDAAPIGPPNTAVEIRVDTAQIRTDLADAIMDQGGDTATTEKAAYKDRCKRMIASVTSHEMSHGTDAEHHTAAAGGRASPYGDEYCGEVMCMMRYDYDLVDVADATHTNMYGVRTAALSPPGTLPARFEFSNYTDKDLSDLIPVANTFCTENNNCRGQIDVKDP